MTTTAAHNGTAPPGTRFDITHGRLRVDPETGPQMTTTVQVRDDGKEPGRALIGWSAWLLAVLAAGVFAVSYAGLFVFIYAARHQNVASNIEAGMFDLAMTVFAMLGLGLSLARKPARTERFLVMACALASAGMNYLAADIASPRSVAVFVAPPILLAVCVDRVIAVVRRWRCADPEQSPWAPAGRAVLALAAAAGTVALYTLRLILDPLHTPAGLRRIVLAAAPLPEKAPAGQLPAGNAGGQPPAAGSKKAALIAAYQADPAHGDRARTGEAAERLYAAAGLAGAGTARTYIGQYLSARQAAS